VLSDIPRVAGPVDRGQQVFKPSARDAGRALRGRKVDQGRIYLVLGAATALTRQPTVKGGLACVRLVVR
jgi:hypothetical protein